MIFHKMQAQTHKKDKQPVNLCGKLILNYQIKIAPTANIPIFTGQLTINQVHMLFFTHQSNALLKKQNQITNP